MANTILYTWVDMTPFCIRYPVRDRATFKLVVMVYRCRAPQYLAVHCVPLSSQRQLCSAERNLLHVPHVTDSARTAAWLVQLLVRPPETNSWTLSATRTRPKPPSGGC